MVWYDVAVMFGVVVVCYGDNGLECGGDSMVW